MEKIQTLKIEKLSSEGEGIARLDGYVIFVEKSVPEDIVEVEIIKENKNFAKAKILKIISPSKYRTQPFCALYNACGACSLQHIHYEAQLKFKKEIVQDAIKNIAGLDIIVDDVVPSPQKQEFRCKIQYPTSQTKVSKRVLAGYYKPKTHELINIKHCPIQPKICDEIMEFIRQKVQELSIDCYNEKTAKGLLRHITIRHSKYTGENLVTFVLNANEITNEIKQLALALFKHFDTVKGVCANFNTRKSNVIMGEKTILMCGNPTIEEKILDKIFKIGANTFFQVNPKSAENIFKYVKEIIARKYKKPTVLDAYAGIASFGIVISDICQKVISVEENPDSTTLVQEVLQLNKINNLEIHTADTAKYMEKCSGKFDVIILDPPRKGCDEKTLDETLRLCTGQIIYISCNPATLARDLKYLTAKNAKIQSIRPFDMFCHTPHIENVAIISK